MKNGKIKELESELKSAKGTIKELSENLKNEQKNPSNLEKRILMMENLFKSIAEDIECPISGPTFKKPVVAPSGNLYEEKDIKDWIH